MTIHTAHAQKHFSPETKSKVRPKIFFARGPGGRARAIARLARARERVLQLSLSPGSRGIIILSAVQGTGMAGIMRGPRNNACSI